MPLACVNVTGCPAIVTTACRVGPVFFATVNLIGPLPEPLGVWMVIQPSPVVTAHEQPAAVVSPNSQGPPSLPSVVVGILSV